VVIMTGRIICIVGHAVVEILVAVIAGKEK